MTLIGESKTLSHWGQKQFFSAHLWCKAACVRNSSMFVIGTKHPKQIKSKAFEKKFRQFFLEIKLAFHPFKNEFFRAIFCLLAVLIYRYELDCEKGFLCSFSEIVFLYFNSKVCTYVRGYQNCSCKKSEKWKKFLTNFSIQLRNCFWKLQALNWFFVMISTQVFIS